jgi:hypothetical protein
MSTGGPRVRSFAYALLVFLALGFAPAPALAQDEDKARGRPAAASSVQEPGEYAGSFACVEPSCGPEQAVDGSLSTRWASDRADGQWWQVDLGRPRLVDEVRVHWQDAYAVRYLVGTSLDGITFAQAEDRASAEGVKVTRLPAREARYVRVTGLERRVFRGTGRVFGFSMWDVGVFGPPDPAPGTAPRAVTQAPSPAPPASTNAPLALMGPFPVVRIRGSLTRTGVRITLLGVRAPQGARVEVLCDGRGCSRRRGVYVSRRGYVRARRFQRRLRAGAVLEVLVTQPGVIGKYTRFRIRRGEPPVRTDRCARFGSTRPVSCPVP